MGHWIADNIGDLSKKTAIVTGANGGLGLEITRELAGKGCHVVMACRQQAKAKEAALHIRHEYPQASLRIVPLDLASLESVTRFAHQFMAQYGKLDLLLNNAGVMGIPYSKTEDGFEMQFGTNHLGHFALTGLLLEILLNTPDSRVVTTSSIAHVLGKVDFSNLQWERGYNSWGAYFQSKLANLFFAYELQRQLDYIGANVRSVAAHPGWAATDLQRIGPQLAGSSTREKVASLLNRVLAQSAEMGALPVLYAATAPNVRGGDFFGPERLSWFGYPQKVSSSARSRDQVIAARLWDVSEELTGVVFPFDEKKVLQAN